MNAVREPFFIDKDKDKKFENQGYLIDGKISNDGIIQLIDLFNTLSIPDSYGFGFNVGLNTNDHSIRKAMQDGIKEIIESEVTQALNYKCVFTATFMNKLPQSSHLLPAHQDWTFTEEEKFDSVMCWIPLIDVDLTNGCMSFVPYSNQLFNYTRAFPFPFNKNPVEQNEKKLLGFMKAEPMQAGQMVFLNHKTAHGSFPNTTNENRLAIGLSIAPKNEPLHIYCLNPKNAGQSIIKYKVDSYFLVDNPHPEIAEAYFNGKYYNFTYEKILEKDYNLPKLSWEYIYNYLTNKGLVYRNTYLNPSDNNLKREKVNTQQISLLKRIFKFIKLLNKAITRI